MADQEQIHRLLESLSEEDDCSSWNEWKKANPDARVDLSGCELAEANLAMVDWSGADLRGANLRGTVLYGAELNGADLRGANLSESKMGHLFGTRTRNAVDLTDADLSGANLRKAYLFGGILIRAKLCGADLSEANLSEANLSEADLSRTKMEGTNLSGANLDEADLEGAWLCRIVGNVSSAINIRCTYLDVGSVRGEKLLDVHDESMRSELERYLQRDEQKSIGYLLGKHDRNPLVGLDVLKGQDEYELQGKTTEDLLWVSYLGVRKSDARPVLLQVLDFHPKYIHRDLWKALRKRFVLQGLKAKGAKHPNLVEVFDVDYAEERPLVVKQEQMPRPFWVLELFPSYSLEEWVQGRQRSFPENRQVMSLIAEAIHHLHSRHRTLKKKDVKKERIAFADEDLLENASREFSLHGCLHPGAVFVDGEGSVKISNLSVLRWQDFAECFHIRPDSIQVPPYLQRLHQYTPKEIQGENRLTPEAEILSMALVFYYILTEVHMPAEMAPKRQDEFAAELSGVELPNHLQKLLCRMVDPEPKNRPDSAEVLRTLRPEFQEKKNAGSLRPVAAASILALLAVALGLFLLRGSGEPSGSGEVAQAQGKSARAEAQKGDATGTPAEPHEGKGSQKVAAVEPPRQPEETRPQNPGDKSAPDRDESRILLERAANPKTDVDELQRLARLENPAIQEKIALNPSASNEILAELGRSRNLRVQSAVARHPNTGVPVLREMWEKGDGRLKKAVRRRLEQPGLRSGEFERCSFLGDISVRERNHEQAAKHYARALEIEPSSSEIRGKRAESLRKLGLRREARDELAALARLEPQNAEVFALCGDLSEQIGDFQTAFSCWQRAVQCKHPQNREISQKVLRLLGRSDLPAKLLEEIAASESAQLRRMAALHPSTPANAIVALACDGNAQVASAVAENGNPSLRKAAAGDRRTSPDLLEKLSQDPIPAVRLEVARNASASPPVVARLMEDPDASVRSTASSHPHARRTKRVEPEQTPEKTAAAGGKMTREDWEAIPDRVAKAPHRQKLDLPNGRYHGQVSNQRMHGWGELTWINGNRYAGQFDNQLPQGCGIITWPDGKKYMGEWKEGRMEGQGVLFLPDGSRYEGSFTNGQRNGRGIFTWGNGDRYEGDFKNGDFDGTSRYTSKDGQIYVGEYRYGKKNGKGVLTWPNGMKYEGEFVQERFEGYGTMYRSDGSVMNRGLWRNGQLEKKSN